MTKTEQLCRAIARERGAEQCGVPPAEVVHHAVPFDVYLGWPCASKSDATAIDTSPAEWRRRQAEPWAPNEGAKMGSAVDAAWLEGGDALDEGFLMRPDLASRRSKAFAELDESTGKTILVGDEPQRVLGMIGALNASEIACAIRDKLDAQVSLVWVDRETEMPCKGRPDLAGTVDAELSDLLSSVLSVECPPIFPGDDLIVDLKTTFDNRPDTFCKQMSNLRYHWQSGHYTSGWEHITGRRTHWLWLTVKSKPVHSVEIYQMPDHATELGRVQMGRVLQTYRVCLESGQFPASSGRITALDLPPWAYREDM